MSKQRRNQEEKKKLQEFKINLDELDALLDRLEKEALIKSDYPLIIEIIKNFATIEAQFKNSEGTVKRLQKLMFGGKTERSLLPADLKATNTGEPAQGHGKKPAAAWVSGSSDITNVSYTPFVQLHQETCAKYNFSNGFIFQISYPDKSQVNCSGVSATTPCSWRLGQGKFAFSSRFCQIAKPD